MIHVDVVRAWPRRHELHRLALPDGATVADALGAIGEAVETPAAVYGERVDPNRPLADGDRVEVLRPLIADPKESRRRRASKRAV